LAASLVPLVPMTRMSLPGTLPMARIAYRANVLRILDSVSLAALASGE